MTTSPVSSEALLTADEFWDLPEPVHGGRMELVAGRVVTEMPVGRLHAKLAARLLRTIGDFVEKHRLGETHVELGHRTSGTPDSVRAPDVSFSTNHLLEGSSSDGFVNFAPSLAIEVISPHDREAEIAGKVEEYLDAGSSRVWIVRPANKTVTVHRPGGDAHTYTVRDTLTSDDAAFTAEGFELQLEQFFSE
ncbi:MAG: Uma2 family endonuclease [Tepidiformaceae bacterium]